MNLNLYQQHVKKNSFYSDSEICRFRKYHSNFNLFCVIFWITYSHVDLAVV